MSTALLTDHYELTMLDAARQSGRASRRSLFEVFSRRLPSGRRYGVVAGTARVLDAIAQFRFGDDESRFLRDRKIVSAETLRWLESYEFRGDIRGYAEGEIYFPHSPLLQIEARFDEAVLLETVILSILNHDCAVAAAASRMVGVAANRPLIEMGSRRTAEHSAWAAARAAYVAGFSATSNLEAGRLFGIPTLGTAAHAFTLLHDSEEEAFAAQVDALGIGTTLLVDTYDIDRGVESAIRVAGTELGGVRIDSGDLPLVAARVREKLDALGARSTRIVVTSDLDEYTIAALQASPVSAYGVGTSVVTGSGKPAAGLVYKLVARTSDEGEWVSVQKTSEGKTNVGGRKSAVRVLGDGIAREEAVSHDAEAELPEGRPLMVSLMEQGQRTDSASPSDAVETARVHHSAAISELPLEAFRLAAGDPALPTVFYPKASTL